VWRNIILQSLIHVNSIVHNLLHTHTHTRRFCITFSHQLCSHCTLQSFRNRAPRHLMLINLLFCAARVCWELAFAARNLLIMRDKTEVGLGCSPNTNMPLCSTSLRRVNFIIYVLQSDFSGNTLRWKLNGQFQFKTNCVDG